MQHKAKTCCCGSPNQIRSCGVTSWRDYFAQLPPASVCMQSEAPPAAIAHSKDQPHLTPACRASPPPLIGPASEDKLQGKLSIATCLHSRTVSNTTTRRVVLSVHKPALRASSRPLINFLQWNVAQARHTAVQYTHLLSKRPRHLRPANAQVSDNLLEHLVANVDLAGRA